MQPREDRHKVLIRARMRAGGLPVDACIRDVSSRGMMIQSVAPPPRGTYVEVVTAGQTIVGRVVWDADMRFGISTRDTIRIEMIVGALKHGRSAPQPTTEIANPRPSPKPSEPALRRSQARALELGALVVFALAMIATVAGAAFETLASPLETVAAFLDPGG